MSWPSDNDKELEKLITSTFTVESGAVIFDNLAEGTSSTPPILANLLTNPVWSERILGLHRNGRWPNDRLWMATGNNLRVGGDMASRTVYVRLAPKAPHPEQRTGFAIRDLAAWIKDPDHRAELLWRLLVLVADWVAAGTPRDDDVPAMRQFTPWARGVGGFLAHHAHRRVPDQPVRRAGHGRGRQQVVGVPGRLARPVRADPAGSPRC